MLSIGLGLCIISHKVSKGLRTVHMGEVKRALNFNYDSTGPFKPLREDGGQERRESQVVNMPSIAAFPKPVLEEWRTIQENSSKMEEGKHQPEFYLEGSKLHLEAITGNLSTQG